MQPRGKHQIFAGAQTLVQILMFKHNTDLTLQGCTLGHYVMPRDLCIAAGGACLPRQHANCSRLSRPVWPQKTKYLSFLNAKGNSIDGRCAVIYSCEVLSSDGCHDVLSKKQAIEIKAL